MSAQPLTKGQNAPLSTATVRIGLELTAPADISALLVTDSGKVRSDADFVFFNQPTGPGVQLVPGQNGPEVAVTLASVPADITQIRVVITLDDASSSFGRSSAPTAHVIDGGTGSTLYSYTIDGLSSESIVIALELYRRGDGWKVRAVGQGYAGGFEALVRDHGVSVDDAPSAPTPAAPPVTAPAPTPPPAPIPAPAPVASAPAPAPTGPPEVSLTKSRPVSLSKGQKVTLKKDGGVALTAIRMGLGWDPIKKAGFFGGGRSADIDLDASALMFSGDKHADVVYFGQLTSKDGSIVHQGDNLTGEGEGDDEVITVDLTRVPAHISAIVFIVTSYRGQTFEQVANAFTRLVDNTINTELARFTLQGGMPFTGLVMAKVYRAGSEWKLQAIGDGINAKHAGEALPQLRPYLS
ncbi:TerD family protein [Rhodococcus sp. MEB064]|uniref:TerD family protein n=1 Tax=Rhodococcus sp. MEB064 TaxID=1587522 RepID=UPI000A8252E6|nr:TerD family protein [Rhodococcus sp. MEB064]